MFGYGLGNCRCWMDGIDHGLTRWSRVSVLGAPYNVLRNRSTWFLIRESISVPVIEKYPGFGQREVFVDFWMSVTSLNKSTPQWRDPANTSVIKSHSVEDGGLCTIELFGWGKCNAKPIIRSYFLPVDITPRLPLHFSESAHPSSPVRARITKSALSLFLIQLLRTFNLSSVDEPWLQLLVDQSTLVSIVSFAITKFIISLSRLLYYHYWLLLR